MTKLFLTFLACCVLGASFAQSPHKISIYLQTQFTRTLYDRTKGNNSEGIGLGLEGYFCNRSKIKPTIVFTADAYLLDDKVARLNGDNEILDDVSGMINLLGGVSYHPVNKFYASLVAGPSFIGSQTLFAVKPSIGIFFSNTQRWTGKISYLNVFDRDKESKRDFGAISVAIGLRLY